MDKLGLPDGWEFAVVYHKNSNPIRFQVVDPQSGDLVNTEQLKVGLWEHAFTSPGGSVKDDFIDHDVDRFFLSISDSSKQGQGEIFAALETLSADPNYLDDLNRIRLKEEPSDSGQFLSQPLLLVADHPDDDRRL